MAEPQGVDLTVQSLLLEQGMASDRYTSTRTNVETELRAGGLSDHDIGNLLESYERQWRPGFDDAQSLGGNNTRARQSLDQALRSHVDPATLSSFVAALKSHRATSATAARAQENLYAIGGGEILDKTLKETEVLREMRRNLVTEARRINPQISITAQNGLFGTDAEADAGMLDPVRKTLALSLDVTTGSPRQAMLRDMWPSMEGLLSDEEKKILQEHVRADFARKDPAYRSGETIDPEQMREAMIKAFVSYAEPSGIRKPDSAITASFKPIKNFMERASNLARGRGFINSASVWRRALSGQIGERAETDAGLRISSRQANDAQLKASRASVRTMTDGELTRAITNQNNVIYGARQERSGVLHKMFVTSSVARGLSRATNYFSSDSKDALAAEQGRLKELAQGRVLLMAEQTRRDRDRGDQANSSPDRGTDLNEPPSPGSTPLPDGPGEGGPYRAQDMSVRAGLAAASNENGVRVYDGNHASFAVAEPGREGEGTQYKVSMVGREGGNMALGQFSSPDMASTYISQMDGTALRSVSPQASDLAKIANGTDRTSNANADIDRIRASGLLDGRLDEAVARKEATAFVYPLKTGDVLWEAAPGRWQAGSMEDLKAFALSRNDVQLDGAMVAIAQGQKERQNDNRAWLIVPPRDESAAMRAGARWDALEEKFYAPTENVLARTSAWTPPSPATRAPFQFVRQSTGNLPGPTPEQPSPATPSVQPRDNTPPKQASAFSVGAIPQNVGQMNDDQLSEHAKAVFAKAQGPVTGGAQAARERMEGRTQMTEIKSEMTNRGLDTSEVTKPAKEKTNRDQGRD